MRENPYACGSYLLGLDFYLQKPKEIVLIPSGMSGISDASRPESFLKVIFEQYHPHKVVFQLPSGLKSSLFVSSLFQGKKSIDGQTTVYVCHNFSCSKPVNTLDKLEKLLG